MTNCAALLGKRAGHRRSTVTAQIRSFLNTLRFTNALWRGLELGHPCPRPMVPALDNVRSPCYHLDSSRIDHDGADNDVRVPFYAQTVHAQARTVLCDAQ